MKFPYPENEHKSRVICGDPVALAYEWIRAYTENLNSRINQAEDGSLLTMKEVIETAMSHVNASDGPYAWGDYITRGGAFEGVRIDPTFWDKLADFKQIEISHDKRNNFLSFSCSC